MLRSLLAISGETLVQRLMAQQVLVKVRVLCCPRFPLALLFNEFSAVLEFVRSGGEYKKNERISEAEGSAIGSGGFTPLSARIAGSTALEFVRQRRGHSSEDIVVFSIQHPAVKD